MNRNIIGLYYTDLLNAVERSVHLHASGPVTCQPQRLPLLSEVTVFAENYFSADYVRMSVDQASDHGVTRLR